MSRENATEIFDLGFGTLVKGVKVFGGVAINLSILRRSTFNWKAGWDVPLVGGISSGASIVQGVISLKRFKGSTVAEKAYRRLMEFECFLDINGMSVTSLCELLSSVFPDNKMMAFLIAEAIAGSIALWRARNCERYWVSKLEPFYPE